MTYTYLLFLSNLAALRSIYLFLIADYAQIPWNNKIKPLILFFLKVGLVLFQVPRIGNNSLWKNVEKVSRDLSAFLLFCLGKCLPLKASNCSTARIKLVISPWSIQSFPSCYFLFLLKFFVWVMIILLSLLYKGKVTYIWLPKPCQVVSLGRNYLLALGYGMFLRDDLELGNEMSRC